MKNHRQHPRQPRTSGEMKTYIFEFFLSNGYDKRRVILEDVDDQGMEVVMELVRLRYLLPKSTEIRLIGEL